MKRKFKVSVSQIKTMEIETDLDIDTALTLEELAEDLEYQAEINICAILAGDVSPGVIVSRSMGIKINEIKLLDEVKIVK